MSGGTPRSAMSESNKPKEPLQRRSPRFSSPPNANVETDKKMAASSEAVKRRITVKKIVPKKTIAPSENDKENKPRPSETRASQGAKQKVSTPSPTADEGRSSSAEKRRRKAAMPSPILPGTPPPPRPQEPAVDSADAVWSQKVRRSYSRLSDKSLHSSPESRETLFGFEKLQTPEVIHSGRRCKPGLEGSLTGLGSFTSLLEADDGGASVLPEPDLNIPGVAVVKEKKRRRKVQQIGTTEMDTLAAEMNAVFEEAEEFELVVE